jgi:hypothetical protein
MAAGRAEETDRARWKHTAAMIATALNCRPFVRHANPVKPDDIDPYVDQAPAPRGTPINADNIHELKAFLPKT